MVATSATFTWVDGFHEAFRGLIGMFVDTTNDRFIGHTLELLVVKLHRLIMSGTA